MSIVNKAFFLVDYAKEQMMGKDSGSGGKFGIKDIISGMAQAAMPQLMQTFQNFLGGGQPPKAK